MSHQYRGVQQQQQQQQQHQQQQLTSSNIVYVQVPAGDVRSSRWNGRHYMRAQSICLGSVLVVVGALSVICNVVMAVTYSGEAAGYLTRVIMCAIMVSIRPHVVLLGYKYWPDIVCRKALISAADLFFTESSLLHRAAAACQMYSTGSAVGSTRSSRSAFSPTLP